MRRTFKKSLRITLTIRHLSKPNMAMLFDSKKFQEFCTRKLPSDPEGAFDYWSDFHEFFGANIYTFLVDPKYINKIPVGKLGWGPKPITPEMLEPQLGEVWVLFCFSDELKKTIRANPTCPIRQDGFLLSLEWRIVELREGDDIQLDSQRLSPKLIDIAKTVRRELEGELAEDDGELAEDLNAEDLNNRLGLYPSEFRYHDNVDFTDDSLFGNVESAFGALLASYWRQISKGGVIRKKYVFGKEPNSESFKNIWTFPSIAWKVMDSSTTYYAGISGVSGLKDKFSVAADFGARVVTVAKKQVSEAKRELANLYAESKDPRFKKMAVYGVSFSSNDNLAELARDILRGPIQYLKRIRIRKIATWISIGILTPVLLLLCGMLVHDYPSETSPDGYTPQRQLEIALDLSSRWFFKDANRRNAIRWLKASAESGHAEAQFDLGTIYEDGVVALGIVVDESEALKWYRRAAEQNFPQALAMIGWYHLQGKGGLISDFDKAIPYLHSSATNGVIIAQKVLGGLYETGEIVGETNKLKACQFYSMAAAKGDAEAMFGLYRLYSEGGDGLTASKSVAHGWLQSAAEKGNAKAQSKLGSLYLVEKNYDEALRWFFKAAEQGDAPAQFNLGLMYEDGEGVEQNFTEAKNWYQKAAEQGDAFAQVNLGTLYSNGKGGKKDDVEAAKWFQKAADQGYALAQYKLGIAYQYGEGVQRDYSEAEKWYRKAAEQGVDHAQYSMGFLYCHGEGVEESYEEGIRWYRKAADQGSAPALRALGVLYEEGRGVEQSYSEAEKWLKKAAMQGDAVALNELGLMYSDGKGVVQNHVEAAKWFQKAAEQGFAVAQFNIGLSYEKGQGVGQNLNDAIKWYEKAAEQGYAPAQLRLAIIYNIGDASVRNYSEAVRWCKKAAEQGDVGAQCVLGEMYDFGKGVEQNSAEAINWYRKAALQGNACGQYSLGNMYSEGRGVTRDDVAAFELYRKAALQEHSLAQSHLGVAYSNGIGVKKDKREAFKWFQKAATNGNVYAMCELGIFYENGYGVERDDLKALEWYKMAALKDNVVAQFNLGAMYYNGQVGETNYVEAMKWFRMAADNGSAEAKYNIGVMYKQGQGVEKDLKSAEQWFKDASESGYTPSPENE